MVKRMLRKVCFFKALTPREINQILAIARLRRYKNGDAVFMKEDIGSQFFIVKCGRIKIFTAIGAEKKKTFAYLRKGDFFGEMSLLGGKVRSASAEAVEDSELLVISKKNFKALIQQSPDFTLKLLYTLANRLSKSDKEIESMLFHNILGRLAGAIIDLAGDKPMALKIAGRANQLKMSLNQNELADYMGTTRVPVCRAINTLKRSGVIDYKRGELIVLDMDKLRSIAGNTAARPLCRPVHAHAE